MNDLAYIKIKKPLARKMYYNGITFEVIMTKTTLEDIAKNAELPHISINYIKYKGVNFDRIIREFEAKYTSKDLGYYASYYVLEEAYNTFKNCEYMCK